MELNTTQNTNQLIRSLGEKLEPVKPFTKTRTFCFLYTAACALSIIAWVEWYGLRRPIMEFFGDPWFYVEMLLVFAGVVVAGYTTIAMATPGQVTRRLYRTNVWIFAGICVLILMQMLVPHDHREHVEQIGWRCVFGTVLYALPPLLFLTLILRKGLVVERRPAARILFFAALLVASIGVRFCCITSSPFHLLVWHYLPILVLVPIGEILVMAILRALPVTSCGPIRKGV